MKLWIHPTHKGGGQAAPRAKKRPGLVVSERIPFGRIGVQPTQQNNYGGESLSAFITSGLLSAILAAVVTCGVSYLAPPESGSIAESSRAAMEAMYASFDSSGDVSPERQKFLAGLLSEEAFVRKTQVHFISALIQSQLKGHPNPEPLAQLIVAESVLADYDPFLVAAVIRSESMFQRTAISHVGAQGLMQIMPDTARYLAKKTNIDIHSRGLYDPRTNIKLGIAYLKYLEKMFKGNRQRALIAYNWGPGNVGLSIKNRTSPPQSTIHYAQKIMHHHSKWKQQYMQLASNAGMSVG